MASLPGVKLAEMVASLSLATDLGLGLPEEHVLCQTVIATRLARLAGFDEDEQAATFYVSLLAWVGCIADSHELAHWFGDDRQIRADSYQVDKVGLPMMRMMVSHVGAGSGPVRRMTILGRFLGGGFREAVDGFVTHCQTTGNIAERLGLDDRVRRGLPQAFERWDGKGVPGDLAGERIEPSMRIVQIADDTEVFCRLGGPSAAVEMLLARRGTEFDPTYVDLLVAHADEILGDLATVDAWAVVIDGCRPLDRTLSDDDLESALEILADYGDLKSPWYLGHSRAVADLASVAAGAAGLAEDEVTLVRRSALVHRLGAAGVSTGLWNKPPPYSSSEQERLRTVPYLTERTLARQPELARLGAIAGMSHERMDGSGYPRGLSGAAIPTPARILAAADFYQALAEDRPGRSALDPAARARSCQEEVAAGRLDGSAVRAVLSAAGHKVRRRVRHLAGLTPRELEVLELLVRGLSNKEIASRLTVSPRTVATHIEHIYTKTGVSGRGAAAMFALQHGLVDASGTASKDR